MLCEDVAISNVLLLLLLSVIMNLMILSIIINSNIFTYLIIMEKQTYFLFKFLYSLECYRHLLGSHHTLFILTVQRLSRALRTLSSTLHIITINDRKLLVQSIY